MTTADHLHAEILDLSLEKLSLLTKNGRLPALGSWKRVRWNQLCDQIDTLMDKWAAADRAERLARNKN